MYILMCCYMCTKDPIHQMADYQRWELAIIRAASRNELPRGATLFEETAFSVV